jgi:CheY-like chemotaxis protein
VRRRHMARVRLIHWNPTGAAELARVLERSGHRVDHAPFSPESLTALRSRPPDAFVIDLSRSPAQGRDVGVLLRRSRATREVPLVFAGGEPEKVGRVRELLPDATFTEWRRIRGAVSRALKNAPSGPVVPESSFAAYAGAPLSKKLGIRDGFVVALVEAPEGFERVMRPLPSGAVIRRGARGKCDLAIWFVRTASQVERRIAGLGEFAGAGGLWVAWPKRASGVRTDLTQAVVRKMGLASGLVDYKVCSIDKTWSGLRFTVRGRRSGKK